MSTLTQTQDGVMRGPGATTAARLSSVRRQLLRALIFEALVIPVNAFGALAMVGATIGMATEDNFTGVNLYFGYLSDGGIAVLLVAGLALTLAVAIRTWKMLNAVNDADIATLKKLSSLGWAVVAIFSSYVVPGILLLRANDPIRSLDGQS